VRRSKSSFANFAGDDCFEEFRGKRRRIVGFGSQDQFRQQTFEGRNQVRKNALKSCSIIGLHDRRALRFLYPIALGSVELRESTKSKAVAQVRIAHVN